MTSPIRFPFSPNTEILGVGCVCSHGKRERERNRERTFLNTVTAVVSNWEFITKNWKVLLETFWPRALGRKIWKIQGQIHQGSNYQDLGQKYRNLTCLRSVNCSLRQKPPCTGPEKVGLHLSSLNLLASILFFLPSSLFLMCEECLHICFRCGFTEMMVLQKEVMKQGKLFPLGKDSVEEEQLKTWR